MPRAIVVRTTGGPDVMKLENIAAPKAPEAGQVLVRHTAIGVNYMDTYYRSGLYKAPRLPMIPGMEACGVIEAVGEGVKMKPGSRVVYGTSPVGSYCESRLINERYLVGVPDDISDEVAAAVFAKGLTAHYLLCRTYQVKKGDAILIHAAAGGVGQIMGQWAKMKGAKVIGTAGGAQKVSLAKECGYDYVIDYTSQDFVKEVERVTKGQGVTVVYDSVGKDTFAKSMQCLTNMGLLVSFGQSSGAVPPLNILSLSRKGIYVTRPSLLHYKATKPELILSAIELFNSLLSGDINVNISKKYKLEDAAQAHKDLENRNTTGSVILTL